MKLKTPAFILNVIGFAALAGLTACSDPSASKAKLDPAIPEVSLGELVKNPVAYAGKSWDQGLARMKPLVEPAKGLKPRLLAEMLERRGYAAHGVRVLVEDAELVAAYAVGPREPSPEHR